MSDPSLSHVRLFVTLWTVAHQPPLSMELSKQEYRSGLPFPSPRDLPDPGIEPVSLSSPAWQVDFLPLHHLGSPHMLLNFCSFFSLICLLSQRVSAINLERQREIYFSSSTPLRFLSHLKKLSLCFEKGPNHLSVAFPRFSWIRVNRSHQKSLA